MVKREEFECANKRYSEIVSTTPNAVSAHYDQKANRIVIELASHLEIAFAPQDAEGLERATPAQLKAIEITPSGLGIHFPKLDADIYLPALLEGFLGSRAWMASRLGAVGGNSRSRAKVAASRTNGRRGGRPAKNHKTAAPQPRARNLAGTT